MAEFGLQAGQTRGQNPLGCRWVPGLDSGSPLLKLTAIAMRLMTCRAVQVKRCKEKEKKRLRLLASI